MYFSLQSIGDSQEIVRVYQLCTFAHCTSVHVSGQYVHVLSFLREKKHFVWNACYGAWKRKVLMRPKWSSSQWGAHSCWNRISGTARDRIITTHHSFHHYARWREEKTFIHLCVKLSVQVVGKKHAGITQEAFNLNALYLPNRCLGFCPSRH